MPVVWTGGTILHCHQVYESSCFTSLLTFHAVRLLNWAVLEELVFHMDLIYVPLMINEAIHITPFVKCLFTSFAPPALFLRLQQDMPIIFYWVFYLLLVICERFFLKYILEISPLQIYIMRIFCPSLWFAHFLNGFFDKQKD